MMLALLLAASASRATPETIARGKALYGGLCMACHGEAGRGDGPASRSLNPRPRDLARAKLKQGASRRQVFATITQGVPGTAMTGNGQLAEPDRWALVDFVLSLRKGRR